MKRNTTIILILLLAGLALYALTTAEPDTFTGRIRLSGHSVYLDTASSSHLMLLTAGLIRDSVWIPSDSLQVSIRAFENSETKNLEVISITDHRGTVEIRDLDRNPLHQANSSYRVNAAGCIGCNLCPRNCPVGAISMQGRKAVIDQSKCIECGVCISGKDRWRGCPVRAISK